MDHELDFERAYWGDCTNTFDEDQKHYVYARCMGLTRVHYSFDVEYKSIMDIGGGPSSMLLKCTNLTRGKVVDPIEYPPWTRDRYRMKNIDVDIAPGESVNEIGWDEVWIYNCLQHTEDPARIIRNAQQAAPVLRIFEWIDLPPHPGHPHLLSEHTLNEWIGNYGQTARFAESGCFGRAYYGVFKQ